MRLPRFSHSSDRLPRRAKLDLPRHWPSERYEALLACLRGANIRHGVFINPKSGERTLFLEQDLDLARIDALCADLMPRPAADPALEA